MNIRFNVWVSLIGWLLTASVLAANSEWKTECVGRYQVSVPGEVESILPAPRALSNSNSDELLARYLQESKTFGGNKNWRFRNLNKGINSKFIYLGDIGITVEVPEIDFENLRKMYKGRKQYYLKNAPLKEAQGYSATANDYREKAAEERPLDFDKKNMFGWDYGTSSFIYLYQDNRIFIFDLSLSVDKTLQSFHPRPLFDLPKGEGICIPYGFIADDDKPGRQIGVTMRLIDHPDVEIFFEDRSAANYGIKQTEQTQERTELSMLWQQQAHSSKRIDLAFSGYRSLKLDGRDGTASFVEITRKDDSTDYGFAAVVSGDHTAKSDTPQLMLYVIRTASRAKGKPVSKSELKDMAHKIAASIKRREVQ